MTKKYTMIIETWLDTTTINNLTKQQVIDIVLGKQHKGIKHLNSKITIKNQETEETEKIDTTDDFELFGTQYAPGF